MTQTSFAEAPPELPEEHVVELPQTTHMTLQAFSEHARRSPNGGEIKGNLPPNHPFAAGANVRLSPLYMDMLSHGRGAVFELDVKMPGAAERILAAHIYHLGDVGDMEPLSHRPVTGSGRRYQILAKNEAGKYTPAKSEQVDKVVGVLNLLPGQVG
jgi:hypothetical protein